MAMPSLYRPRISPISLAVSPWAIWVVRLSMNWACPPSWAIPASNEARVLVEEKKNSMASTLSRSSGCGIPSARSRFSWKATSSSVSSSPFVHSWKSMTSLPLRWVCISSTRPSVDRAEDGGQQRHPHDHAVKRLEPVASVAGVVDVGGQLVHPRQRMQDDGVRLAPVAQQLPGHLVGGRGGRQLSG